MDIDITELPGLIMRTLPDGTTAHFHGNATMSLEAFVALLGGPDPARAQKAARVYTGVATRQEGLDISGDEMYDPITGDVIGHEQI